MLYCDSLEPLLKFPSGLMASRTDRCAASAPSTLSQASHCLRALLSVKGQSMAVENEINQRVILYLLPEIIA